MLTKPGLRHWQSRAIEKALHHYQCYSHFFVQATPGSGKTRMTAELAKRMLDANLIDLVICFAPSREVVSGITSTYAAVIKQFKGNAIASLGAAFTYQSMEHLSDDFWRTLAEARALVVFDEIHHCAGHQAALSNAWGQQILQNIQDRATYTLGLSGTPWRSDDLPIALARYSNPEGRLITDYRYGLRAAVNDQVCRVPHITLIDNSEIRLIEKRQTRGFSGIGQLLRESKVTYEDVLRRNDIIDAVIEAGAERLTSIRLETPSAGGLIVATDIDHARQITKRLADLGEDFRVVNSESPNAKTLIEQFRRGTQRWIVAVGMVSEGTDIPRLRVCCYLSRIRTELHFRQVLGRVLRRTGPTDQSAWLYAIAEPRISEYASRVADDLPDEHAVLSRIELSGSETVTAPDSVFDPEDSEDLLEDTGQVTSHDGEAHLPAAHPELRMLSFSQYYRQLLLTAI